MDWRRSSRCDNSLCVWVRHDHRTTWVQDSGGQELAFGHADWRALLASLRR